jgi:hypothetical protein
VHSGVTHARQGTCLRLNAPWAAHHGLLFPPLCPQEPGLACVADGAWMVFPQDRQVHMALNYVGLWSHTKDNWFQPSFVILFKECVLGVGQLKDKRPTKVLLYS